MDLQGESIASLYRGADGDDDSDEEDEEQEIPACTVCACTDGTCQHAV
jgi:hypothetical protein